MVNNVEMMNIEILATQFDYGNVVNIGAVMRLLKIIQSMWDGGEK